MPKRISWKKGMRLTDDVLMAADRCTADAVGQALILGSAGRFGLFPSAHPFELSLSVSKSSVDVESLTCLGITRAGDVIDVHYDTKFTNTLDTRVQIPGENDENEYILTINVQPDEWLDTADGYSEPTYFFALVSPRQPVGQHALPIGRIVMEEGWHEDNTNFVPPCLYVSSHPKLHELLSQFLGILRTIDDRTRQQLDTKARQAISIYWPVVQQVLVIVNSEHELMTPQRFQSCVQQVVAAFTTACDLDEILHLEDAETFRNYARVPYSYRMAYLRIRQGMGMCYSIGEKIEKFALLREEPKPVVEAPKPEPPKPTRRTWGGPNI